MFMHPLAIHLYVCYTDLLPVCYKTCYLCVQVSRIRTVTSNANSLMQAGKDEDAFPVQGEAGNGVLWLTEIERL